MTKRDVLLSATVAAWLVGCSGDEITRYTAPRPEKPRARVASHSETQRLLGVILPHGDRTWFVKLVGHPHAIDDVKESFARFLMSLEFAAPGDLKWETPEGWREQPGTGMRYATFTVGSEDEPMELTVTSLGAEASEILPNVNRWRGQIGLSPLVDAQLGEITQEMQLAGMPATLVDFTANAAPAAGKSPPGQPPFAGGSPATPPTGPRPPARPPLSFTTPDGWKKLTTAGPMRVAAFEVIDGEKRAEITVIPLAGSGGSLLDNVNRWRDQISLKPIIESQLTSELRQLEVDGHDAKYLDMIGPESAGDRRQRVLVVSAARGELTWFFKMTGPNDVVDKQKAAFESFVRSVKFD